MTSFHRLLPDDLQKVLEIHAASAPRPQQVPPQQWLAFRLRRELLTPEQPFWTGGFIGTLATRLLNCDESVMNRLVRPSRDKADSKALDAFWVSYSGSRHVVSELSGTNVKLGDYASLFFRIVEVVTRLRDSYVTNGGRSPAHAEVRTRVARLSALARELSQGLNQLQYDLDTVELASAPPFYEGETDDPLMREFASQEKESWHLFQLLDLPQVTISDVLDHLAQLEAGTRNPMQPLRLNQAGAIADALVFEVSQLLTDMVFDDACGIVFHLLEVLAGELNCEMPTRPQVTRRMRGVWDAQSTAE